MLNLTINRLIYIYLGVFIFLSLVLFLLIKVFNVELKPTEIIGIIAFFFTTSTIIFLNFQLVITLNYNKRKAAVDYIQGKVTELLQVKYTELKLLLNKELLVFGENEKLLDTLNNTNDFTTEQKLQIKKKAVEILNFYEIWAISIYQGVMDNTVCYDYQSFILDNYYNWTHSFLTSVRKDLDNERLFDTFELLALDWKLRTQNLKHKDKTALRALLDRRIRRQTLLR